MTLELILDEVCRVIGDYCYCEMVSGKPRAIANLSLPDNPPIAQEIVTSIVVLGHTLCNAMWDIYGVPPARC
jgi:hypothetical protein